MKIAVPVSGDRLSTVFNAADELLVVEILSGGPRLQSRLFFRGMSIIAKVALIKASDVQILICGALPRPVEYMIEAAGIRVIPFIRGTTDDVLAAFLNDELDNHVFVMPGCKRQQREGRREFCARGMSTHKGGRERNESSHTGKRSGSVKPV